MREILIIVRREYIERVRTRAFVLGTVLFPIFLVAIFAFPNMMEGGGSTTRLFVLIDAAPAPVGERFAANFTTPPLGARGNRYQLDRQSGSLSALQEQLNARVLAQEIDGYIDDLHALQAEVFMVGGDHSTPAVVAGHSWHPVPFLFHAKSFNPGDETQGFNEKACARGVLGTFPAKEVLSLAMAHAGRLTKYGA